MASPSKHNSAGIQEMPWRLLIAKLTNNVCVWFGSMYRLVGQVLSSGRSAQFGGRNIRTYILWEPHEIGYADGFEQQQFTWDGHHADGWYYCDLEVRSIKAECSQSLRNNRSIPFLPTHTDTPKMFTSKMLGRKYCPEINNRVPHQLLWIHWSCRWQQTHRRWSVSIWLNATSTIVFNKLWDLQNCPHASKTVINPSPAQRYPQSRLVVCCLNTKDATKSHCRPAPQNEAKRFSPKELCVSKLHVRVLQFIHWIDGFQCTPTKRRRRRAFLIDCNYQKVIWNRKRLKWLDLVSRWHRYFLDWAAKTMPTRFLRSVEQLWLVFWRVPQKRCALI